ncbi:MAG: aldo/keto reductase, partial [Chitinophagaceae bacterium]
MRTKQLGNSTLYASRQGLGCMGMSEFYGERDDATSELVIKEAYDRGITFFDTADMYGPYHNEELLGRAIKPFRQNIV